MSEQTVTIKQDVISKINEIIATHAPELVPRMPRYRYWTGKTGKGKATYAIGWTTERDCHGKFVAFRYRIVNNGRTWRLQVAVSFSRRMIAKARAYKWYEKLTGRKAAGLE